jgi:hypothetical protein
MYVHMYIYMYICTNTDIHNLRHFVASLMLTMCHLAAGPAGPRGETGKTGIQGPEGRVPMNATFVCIQRHTRVMRTQCVPALERKLSTS